jgi:Cdc6-like AAA superfamily ATPase
MTDEQIGRLLVECGRVFTPCTPINRRSLFAGRLNEIQKIVDSVNSSGRHAILYGDRGVGKTSLASILKELFSDYPEIRIGKVNCEANDNFQSVWDKALSEIPIDMEGPNGTEQFTLNQWLNLNEYVGPGQIRKVIQAGNDYIPELVIVFDEFDRLAREHRLMFADTIKDLSDSIAGATIVLVGVANDVTDLIAEHASVSRNIAEIKMPPMTRSEVDAIIHNGLNKLKMTMQSEAFETIVTLAQGYPHYAHLLGKEAATSAINNRRLDINSADVSAAIKSALSDNSYNIADVYHKATIAQRKGALFEQVLIACALAAVDELGFFSSTDVRPVLSALAKKKYEVYGFSQHLDKFASERSRGPVLEKRGSSRCYRYRFRNPLLRPYAIIKGMADGLVTTSMLRDLSNNEMPKKPLRSPRVIPAPKRATAKPDNPSLF